MRKWQNMLIVDVSNINFLKDSDMIKSAFANLCEPLNKVDGIKFSKEYNWLEVGHEYYRLNLGANGINIQKSNSGNQIIKSVSYLINDNNTYEYKNITLNKIYSCGKIDSVDFDYESIIDMLMDIMVVQP